MVPPELLEKVIEEFVLEEGSAGEETGEENDERIAKAHLLPLLLTSSKQYTGPALQLLNTYLQKVSTL